MHRAMLTLLFRYYNQLNSKKMVDDEGAAFKGSIQQQEMNNTLTLLYVLVEVGRWQLKDAQIPTIRQAIGMLAHVYDCMIAN